MAHHRDLGPKTGQYQPLSDKVFLLIATALSCAQGVALPSIILVFGQTIDVFANSVQCNSFHIFEYYTSDDPNVARTSFNTVSGVALVFVYIGLATAVTGYGVVGITSVLASRVARTWRLKYLQALMYQDVEFFDVENTPGTLLSCLHEDSLSIERALGSRYGSFFQFICMFIAGVIIALAKVWKLGLVMFAALPALILSLAVAIFISSMFQTRRHKYNEVADDIVQQFLTEIRTVVSFNAQKRVYDRYVEASKQPKKLAAVQGIFDGFSVGTVFLCMYGSQALAWWFGGDRLRRGYPFSTGDVCVAIFSILVAGHSLEQIVPSIISFGRGISAMKRMDKVICRTPKINSTTSGVEKDDINGDVELQGVSFAYPAYPDVMVLNKFNLKIASETTVALVGLTGSGKTTILQLIQRFYDPNVGRVLIDGVDLKDYQLRNIRQHIGLVNQEPILFSGSIKQNIALGKLGCNMKDVIQAAKQANIHEFIDSLPDRYDTEVGLQGAFLSGGQRQRIAIARAMLKNPKIVLLDEATSALDSKSEKIVQAALNRLAEGRTTIVVAYRLSTIKNSDQIAVVKEGEMVEAGSHEELIQNPDGYYTNLVKIQMATADVEAEEEYIEDYPQFSSDAASQMSRRHSKSFARRVNESLRRLAANLGQNSGQNLTGFQAAQQAAVHPNTTTETEVPKPFPPQRRQSVDLNAPVYGPSKKQLQDAQSRRKSLGAGPSFSKPLQARVTEGIRNFTSNLEQTSGTNLVGFLPSQQAVAIQALANSQRQFRDATSHRVFHDVPSHRQSLDMPSQRLMNDAMSNRNLPNVAPSSEVPNLVKLTPILSQEAQNASTISPTTNIGDFTRISVPQTQKPKPMTILETTSTILQTTSSIFKAAQDSTDNAVPVNKDSNFTRLLKIQWQQVGAIVMGIISSVVMGAPQPIEAYLLPKALYSLMYSKSQFYCRQDASACTCEQLEKIREGELTQIQAADYTLWRYEWLNKIEVYCYIGIAGGFLFLSMLHNWSFTYMGLNLSQQTRQLLFRRMLQQEIGFFDFPENSVAALTSRLQSDALLVRGAVGESLGLVIQLSASIIGCLLVAFIARGSSWKVALVILATMPLYVLALYIQTGFVGSSRFDSDDEIAIANNLAYENTFNIRIVQSYVLEDDVKQRYAEILNPTVKTNIKKGVFEGSMHGISNFVQFGVIALGVWYGGTLLAKDELNVQQFFQAFLAAVFIGNSIANSQIIFPDFTKAKPAMVRIFEIVDRKPLIDGESEKGYKLDNIKGQVEYREITFVYPTRPEVTILNNFSLRCDAGKTTAMVGETGSGKSTVLTLLQRFYDPESGQIYFDGINIRKLNLKWLRDQVSLVTQDPVLFNASLIENLRIGRQDATYEEAMEACQKASIKEFVENFPQQLDTQIGDKGVRLSKGQKQLIAIARAVLKNPRVLMLDEATRALDFNSEKMVQNALDSASKSRTTVVIAHRLSTIRYANKIAVVQRGKLVEEGTHQQLVRIPDGVYKGLLKASE